MNRDRGSVSCFVGGCVKEVQVVGNSGGHTYGCHLVLCNGETLKKLERGHDILTVRKQTGGCG